MTGLALRSRRRIHRRLDRFQRRLPFDDLIRPVGIDRALELLHETAARPSDFDAVDLRRLADADVRAKRRSAEAAAARDIAINLAHAAFAVGDIETNARADRKPVCLHSLQ